MHERRVECLGWCRSLRMVLHEQKGFINDVNESLKYSITCKVVN